MSDKLKCVLCRKPFKAFIACLPVCGGSHLLKPKRKPKRRGGSRP